MSDVTTIQKIDLVLAYILAAAGQENFGNQEVGPIHLIKYLYLADLAFAEANNGETFTKVEWQFYKYGPWSSTVYERIDKVTADVNAVERSITSLKYEDFIRWKLIDDDLFESLQKQLPFEIRRTIKQAVHEFGDDTTALLHHVYTTWPMLNAAPNEILCFKRIKEQEIIDRSEDNITITTPPELTKKEMKKRKEALAAFKDRIQSRLTEMEKYQEMVKPEPAPRYDDTFLNGTEWLDGLAGAPVEESFGEIVVSDNIWKSRARSDESIP
jgi:hypothetical protein